jgi:hypothetical protein
MEPPTPDFDRLLSSIIGLRLDGDVLDLKQAKVERFEGQRRA